MKAINEFIKASIDYRFSVDEYKKINEVYKEAINRSKVNIEVKRIDKLKDWQYDFNSLKHYTGRFYSIKAINLKINDKEWCQPIIDQPEIGILALL
tara:strand:- start:375 stop:662 length:288 start_codon:yes stop_codon:yes gene_type:complete